MPGEPLVVNTSLKGLRQSGAPEFPMDIQVQVQEPGPSARQKLRPQLSRGLSTRLRGAVKDIRVVGGSGGGSLPLGLLMSPFVVGLLLMVILLTSRIATDGFVSVPGWLDQSVPIVELYNFWIVAVIGGMPMLMSCLYWMAFNDCEIIASRVLPRAKDERADRSAEASSALHGELVKRAERILLPELWATHLSFLCYMTSMVITFYFVLDFNFIVMAWISQQTVKVFFYAVMGFGVLYIPTLLAWFRAQMMRKEGVDILKYTAQAKGRASQCFFVALLSFGFIARIAISSPPLTRAMTLVGDGTNSTTNPCALSREASYLANCTADPRPYAPRLDCSDGGWAEYRSAYFACLAAEVYPGVRAKTYAAFGIFMNQMAGIVAGELEFLMDNTNSYAEIIPPR